MVRKILVPVDFSPCSDAALEYATFLARRLKAALHIVHVWDPPSLLNGLQDFYFATRNELVAKLSACLAEVDRFGGAEVTSRLEIGSPGPVIIDTATRQGFNLIVMGVHGQHRGLARFIRGSVAEKVVRQAPCPVLTIHESDLQRAAVKVGVDAQLTEGLSP